MFTLSCWKNIGVCLLLLAISSSAQTFTTLHTFDVTDGAFPFGTLVQGLDGNFYGTTAQGNGRNQCALGCGTVFKITPEGTLTTLHNFDKTDGAYPVAGLVLGTDGNFYGSTFGDDSPQSTSEPLPSFIFQITPDGTLTNLPQTAHVASPSALMQNVMNGTFYGTAGRFVFSATADGESFIHTFCGQPSCGGTAHGYNLLAPLIQGTDLFMYGTTEAGGEASIGSPGGTVFKIGTGGVVTTVHTFQDSEGVGPVGALAEGSDGNFYGTTSGGGEDGGGTVFEMSPSGEVTTLCQFASSTDSFHPVAGVIQGTDGNFYGTTEFGGAFVSSGNTSGYGTVFQVTAAGTLTTLHSFDVTDGVYPQAGLVQGTDGNLYGVTTGTDATHAWGTVFKISMGLAPFLKTVPVAAYPGKQIFILGTNLTGATSVTFGGTSAAFTVVSATEITATVPKGAAAGTVQVVTPSGTLSSNVPFRVF
jgi:uncharacterized repeat protein (TIGR03803 family)